MKIDPHIFRAYDVRGDVRTQLTPEVAKRIGCALTESGLLFRPPSTLVVGRDARTHSLELQQNLMQGLSAFGDRVVDLGQITTPMMYYALFRYAYDGGVMITGSHNPVFDNGLKICRKTESFVQKDMMTLQNCASNVSEEELAKVLSRPVQTRSMDIVADYEKEILSRVKPKHPIKIVIDAGNGVAGQFAKSLFSHYASALTCLYCEPDGTFPNHHPDPSVASNMADLQKAVLESGADIGLAFDGDGDRLGVVDKNGEIISAEKLIILFAREILKHHPGATILADVKCSKQTFDDIKAHGGNPLMTQTGHALIKARIRETHADLAGEMSGHFFFGNRWFGFDDALYAGARIVEIASNAAMEGKTLSDLLADLPPVYATPELRIPCPDDAKFDLAIYLGSVYCDRYPVSKLDGARIDFPNGWALIRASNTQPVLVVRVEGNTPCDICTIMSDIIREMSAFAESRHLSLDFKALQKYTETQP